MKIVALDIGDKWVGTAISDYLKITCRPYKTVEAKDLHSFIKTILAEEQISTIVVGHPKTLRGTESEQTHKVVQTKEELEKIFPQASWVLWDEKFSSQYAAKLKSARSKKEKVESHSIAAAFILKTYLDHLQFMANM